MYNYVNLAEQGVVQKQIDLSLVTAVVDQTVAQQAADEYLAQEVSTALQASDGVFIPLARPVWQFAVQFCTVKLASPVIMATIDVDAIDGRVVPLTDEQVESLQERISALIIIYKNSNLAKFPPALRIPVPAAQVDKTTAQATANHYLHTTLGSNFVASIGAFVPTGRPVWLFDIRTLDSSNTLGVFAVNALTGAPISLTDRQLQEIQERSRHVTAAFAS